MPPEGASALSRDRRPNGFLEEKQKKEVVSTRKKVDRVGGCKNSSIEPLVIVI